MPEWLPKLSVILQNCKSWPKWSTEKRGRPIMNFLLIAIVIEQQFTDSIDTKLNKFLLRLKAKNNLFSFLSGERKHLLLSGLF